MSILTLELPDDVAEALERLPAGERNNFAVSTLRNGLRSYSSDIRPDAEMTRATPESELGVREAADFLGVTGSHLLTLLANREISSRREGDALYVRIGDLLRYRDENKSRRLATLTQNGLKNFVNRLRPYADEL